MRDQQSHHRPGHVEELSGQRALHVEVEGAGAVEAGRDVDLQQPGLQLRVEENIKPKELETSVISPDIPGSLGCDLVPPAEDRLHTNILDPLPDWPPVYTQLGLKILPEGL